MNTKITVFTPTYNRAYILDNAYKSLISQQYKNFKWIIVDDGSTDETKAMVKKWINEDLIDKKYVYQSNQGRFAAFNNAKIYFDGDLVITLDSDDYLKNEALINIVRFWERIDDKDKISGIIAYFEGSDGIVIGSDFPRDLSIEKSYVLYDKFKMIGDKFMIYRNDLIQKVNYKIYKNERFGGDAIIFNEINDIYPMIIYREKLCHREYQTDSITNNLIKHHYNSPKGMRDHYLDALYHEKYNKWNIIKHTVGYIAFSKIANDKFREIYVKANRKKLLTTLIIPGYLYASYLKFKNKKTK